MPKTHTRSGTYAPRGVVTDKTIQVRLIKAELTEFSNLASKEGVSESALGRRLLMRGMRAIKEGEAV